MPAPTEDQLIPADQPPMADGDQIPYNPHDNQTSDPEGESA